MNQQSVLFAANLSPDSFSNLPAVFSDTLSGSNGHPQKAPSLVEETQFL